MGHDDDRRRLLFKHDQPPKSDLWWGIALWCAACVLAIGVGTCWAMSGGPP